MVFQKSPLLFEYLSILLQQCQTSIDTLYLLLKSKINLHFCMHCIDHRILHIFFFLICLYKSDHKRKEIQLF